MAFGYARSTGKVGVYSVVPGPGVLNSSAALCTAYGASTPVVCITAEIPTEYIGQGKGHLHELPDQLATLRTLTKWAGRIDRPADAPALVAEAFREATSGRPRPVALEMPWDVMEHDEDVVFGPLPRHAPAAGLGPGRDRRRGRAARRGSQPDDHGRRAAPSRAAGRCASSQSSCRHRSSRSAAGAGSSATTAISASRARRASERWRETDVVLGIGSRLELQWFRWAGPATGRRSSTSTSTRDRSTRLRPDVAVVGDAAHGAQAAARRRSARVRHRRDSRRDEFEAVRAQDRPRDREGDAVHRSISRRFAERFPRDGFLVEEICQAGFTSYFGFPVYEPRTFVTGGHQGTLGFGFPTALGVKAGNPDRAVVSITGDGGFQFGLQELATAVQHDLAARDGAVQQQRVRQRPARPAASLRREGDRGRAPESRLRGARGELWSRRSAEPRRPTSSQPRWRPLSPPTPRADRGADPAGERGVAVGIPEAGSAGRSARRSEPGLLTRPLQARQGDSLA